MDKRAFIHMEGEYINGKLSIRLKNNGDPILQLHMIANYIIEFAKHLDVPSNRIFTILRQCVQTFRVQKNKKETKHDPPPSD